MELWTIILVACSAGIIVGLLLYIILWYCLHPKPKSVDASGIQRNISVPHTDQLEIYQGPISSNSAKVRLALEESGLKFKNVHMDMTKDLKSKEFLKINPAGTVPLLVYDGHPIYESYEQIRFVDGLINGKLSLRDDSSQAAKTAEIDEWVDYTSMEGPAEIFDENGGRDKVGNNLPIMTLPIFIAKGRYDMGMGDFLKGLQYAPIAGIRIPAMILATKTLGGNVLKKSKIHVLFSQLAGKMKVHLDKLEEGLGKYDGPYLMGHQFTLADISWMPIIERMYILGMWDLNVDETSYPRCCQYWKDIAARPAYERTNEMNKKDLEGLLPSLARLYSEYPWIRDYQRFDTVVEDA